MTLLKMKHSKIAAWVDNNSIKFYEKNGFKMNKEIYHLLHKYVEYCTKSKFMTYGFEKNDICLIKKVI